MALGLLWLTLWQSHLRWLGLVFAVAGVDLALGARQPDLVADARGQALRSAAPTGACMRSTRAAIISRWRNGWRGTPTRAIRASSKRRRAPRAMRRAA